MTDARIEPRPVDSLALAQLDRVLGFFPRVDTKASFLMAVNLGLITILLLNVSIADLRSWLVIPLALSVTLIVWSLWELYVCQFPRLRGRVDSIVYFRSIAALTQPDYEARFNAISNEDFLRDILDQIWRNSEILRLKYNSVEKAFRITAAGLVPWLLFLAGLAFTNSKMPVFST